MSKDILKFTDDFNKNTWIKIGTLAILCNVFVGIINFILSLINFSSYNALMGILLGFETISFILIMLFSIGIVTFSNELQNQTGLIAGATLIIVHVITYLNLYFYPYPIMSAIVLANGLIFLIMIATFIFFLLNLSKKYEEKIILYTVLVWLAVTVANFVFALTWPIFSDLTIAIRDFFTFCCFSVIIREYEGTMQKNIKKPVDYKHVKVKYEE